MNNPETKMNAAEFTVTFTGDEIAVVIVAINGMNTVRPTKTGVRVFEKLFNCCREKMAGFVKAEDEILESDLVFAPEPVARGVK